MPQETRIVAPGPDVHSVRLADGTVVRVPENWSLLPPGDAGLTRRVKAAGPTWTVQEKVGRRMFSRGVWAPTETIERIRADLTAERDTPQYAKRREADAHRRAKAQTVYVEDFRGVVVDFLAFHPRYATLAGQFADAVTKHATPVGSGTVARTQRIPIERRAEAAVIAWMRHQTTAYDNMPIPRVKENDAKSGGCWLSSRSGCSKCTVPDEMSMVRRVLCRGRFPSPGVRCATPGWRM
jgi:hypothetical protein